MTKPPANVLQLPLHETAEMAVKAAVVKVFIERARQGLPVAIWRDDAMVELTPEEVQAEAARLQAE